MATILSIETSAEVCSVSLSSDGFILLHREEWKGHNHAASLSGFIAEALAHLREHGMKLDAVAVSMGPGSYTGLRIGLSEAKGLAYSLGIPLIGVDTLELLAVRVMFSGVDLPDGVLYVPMVDARRMEVFMGVYDQALLPQTQPGPVILDGHTLDAWIEKGPVAIFGSGAAKAMELIKRPELTYISGIIPLATDMLALAERSFRDGRFLDLAYSTPSYLKEFYSTAKASAPKA